MASCATQADFRRSAARRCRSDHVGLESLEYRADRSRADPELGAEAHRLIEQRHWLGEVERELLIRRYVFEQTASEIAIDLRSSPPAVRMKLKRLLTKLETC